jgi:hypothetical protein
MCSVKNQNLSRYGGWSEEMAEITIKVPSGNGCEGCSFLDNFSAKLTLQGKEYCVIFDEIVYNKEKLPHCKRAVDEGGFWG